MWLEMTGPYSNWVFLSMALAAARNMLSQTGVTLGRLRRNNVCIRRLDLQLSISSSTPAGEEHGLLDTDVAGYSTFRTKRVGDRSAEMPETAHARASPNQEIMMEIIQLHCHFPLDRRQQPSELDLCRGLYPFG